MIRRCTLLLLALGASALASAQSVHTTKITYDAAGRPSQVDTHTTSTGPSISSTSPTVFRRTLVTHVVIIGSELNGSTVSADAPGFQFSAVNSAPTQVDFDVVASVAVSLGSHSLTLTTPVGSASTGITLRQEPPTLLLADQPWVVGVGETRSYSALLSIGDDVPHTVTVSNSTPAIGTISPASLNYAAGGTQPATPLSATGVALGITQIAFTDPDLATRKRALFVSPPYQATANERTSSAIVGVQVGDGTVTSSVPAISPVVGVSIAAAAAPIPLNSISPVVGVQFGSVTSSTAVDAVSPVVGVQYSP